METSRGGATAATWIFRHGDAAAATWIFRHGDAAAATWICGEESRWRRGRDVETSVETGARLRYRQTLAFGGLIANTGVHVVMYYYYARAALKLRTAWKAWVTRLQIFQFSVSFALLVVTLSGVHGPVASCAGGRALAGNVAFNAILLFLFVGVLGSSKKEPKKDARKRA